MSNKDIFGYLVGLPDKQCLYLLSSMYERGVDRHGDYRVRGEYYYDGDKYHSINIKCRDEPYDITVIIIYIDTGVLLWRNGEFENVTDEFVSYLRGIKINSILNE